MGILRKMKQRAAEMEKSYFPYTWKDKPSIESPINSVNLNHIESGINELDNRVVVLSKDKAEKTELANVFINFEFDENSGVMTFTRFDGSKVEKDTAMEKIALNCYLEGDNFVLELADGSKQTVSLSKFIDTYTFKSTDVIRMSVNGKEVSADIPDGKITLEKLEATVMSTIRQCVLDAQTAKGVAEQAASTAQGWAIGGESFEKNNAKYFSGQSKRYAVGGVEEGDETDNAQYYCEEARKAAEQAAGSVGFDGTASSVSAVDTHNLTGAGAGKKSTVQNLLDVIAQKLVEKVVTSDTFQIVLAKYLVNNGLTTEAGKFGLDAAFGKNLQDQITQQNSNKADKNSDTSLSVKKIVGYSANDYRNAHFFAQSPTNENQNSRAGYGFENIGKNGAFLFLNTVQNMLSVIFNDNTTGNLLIDNTITSSDANQITITGFYRLGGGSANIPSWGGGVGILALKFKDMFIQLAFFNSDTPRFAIRNYYNGKWTAWAEK